MSYPGDYEDEDENGTDYDAVEVSGANPLAVKQISDDYALGVKDRNARRGLEIYAPQQKMFDDFAEALRTRRAGPDFSERMYQLSAALMKPTAYKGLGATLGNVFPVLAEQRAAMRDAEDAKQALLMKYKLQAQEVRGQQLESGFKAEDALAKADYNTKVALAKAAAAGKKGPGITVDPIRGGVVRKDTGATITSANPLDVRDLAQHVRAGRGAEAIMKFDQTYGPGAAELYLNALEGSKYGGY